MSLKRQALFWGALFLFVVGLVLHVQQLFAMSAALVCLRVVSLGLGRRKLRGLEVQRSLPPTLTVGERGTASLTVTNRARTRKVFFTVRDLLPEGLGPTESSEQPVAILGPGQSVTLQQSIEPRRRGLYVPGEVELATADPLGLRRFTRSVPAPGETVVYPPVLRLPYLWPVSSQGPRALRPRRRLRGTGEDFYGVRDYVPGDDPRRISWPTTARRGRLVIAEREQPESLHGLIVLDLEHRVHVGVGSEHTLEYAVVLAATLADQAQERGSAVGLIAAGREDFSLPVVAEPEQRLRLLNALARVQPDGELPLADVVADHTDLLPRHGTVVVLSPAATGGEVAAYLRGLGHPVTWFILDAATFPPTRRRVDYGPLQAELGAVRCRVHLIRGDRPLNANWGRGAHLADRYA
ncbi:MAG: DUF58 domain-containing protein [Armatimonadetes bacterium]|nr:DUF58 domain-containing protein [Armatimonadota bacterium]